MSLRFFGGGDAARIPLLPILCAFLLAAALPAARGEAAERFDGVGRIECAAGDGRAVVRQSTGWVLAAADTVVTAAHGFYPDGAAIDPARCRFTLYRADGTVRDSAAIRYALSPWAQARWRNDSSYDVAIVKLDRAMPVRAVAAIERGSGPAIRPVTLLSFPAGRARTSLGEARPFPAGPLRGGDGQRISDPARLFASSAASAEGSSGGLYYGVEGMAIGLHIGQICAGADGCFNFGLHFDRAMLALVQAVAADLPPADQRIAPATRLASR